MAVQGGLDDQLDRDQRLHQLLSGGVVSDGAERRP